MLTKEQLKDFKKRQESAELSWKLGTVIWIFFILGLWMFLQAPKDPITLTAVLSALIPAVILSWIGTDRGSRIQLLCPNCRASIGKSLGMIRETHTCPGCEQQILEGKVRSLPVVRRHQKHREWSSDQGIHWFLWLLVAFQGYLSYTCHRVHFGRLPPVPVFHFALSMLGLAFAGISVYIWRRSRNRRCLYPFVVLSLLVSYTLSLAWLEFGVPAV